MIHHLRAAGVSVVVDARGTGVPVLVHWGADLGELDPAALASTVDALIPANPPSSLDGPLILSLLPTRTQGWSGRAGVELFRAFPLELRLRLDRIETGIDVDGGDDQDVALRTVVVDDTAGVRIATELALSVQGVLRLRHSVTNTDATALGLASLTPLVPMPGRAAELLDFTGLWTHERRPQRSTVANGIALRESRHGRPGHDSAFLTIAGTPGFGFRHGETWAGHLAFSGNSASWVERSTLGPTVLAAGELLDPGELVLETDETYTSPWFVLTWSDRGLDGLSDRLHPWVRSWSTIAAPRPVVLNTWEAVYFEQSLAGLEPLIGAAAAAGVERFVLDDGWFSGRIDDRRALGDWVVDPTKWPDGLSPLADQVIAAGMDFGIWVEPEMISLDSELARAHPDWVLGAELDGWRSQHVLDLGNPAAFAHILGALDALFAELPIAFVKWDQNRDMLVGSVHRQTHAVYELIDELRRRHPSLEIESCSSGGGRIDLGMLRRTDRVWPSDSNDPLERQQIMRYTSLLVPLEYLGSHVGAARSHTTGRTSSLSFRLITALFGHAGFEWDLTAASDSERDELAEWTALYRRERHLLHTGTVVRMDAADPGSLGQAVISTDRRRALVSHAQLDAASTAAPEPLRVPGLDPDRSYLVTPLTPGGRPTVFQEGTLGWWARGSIRLTGHALEQTGLVLPLIAPENAVLLLLEAD